MPVERHEFEIDTAGNCQTLDLSDRISKALGDGHIAEGVATIFVVGSTASITTTEFEPGLVKYDLKAAFEKIAPPDGKYVHEQTWNDDNGHSHVCASLVGPSATIPMSGKKLSLGQWQQVVLIDFDTRPRKRRIIVQVIGE